MGYLRRLYFDSPFAFVLLVAIVLRLCAVIWSKGYAMHDDHFLVVKQPQLWVDEALAYDHWDPRTGDPRPSAHNLFYVGSQYVVMAGLEHIGVTAPQSKMFVVRLLHALFSLLMVIGVFRIVEWISDRDTARTAGLLMAGLWMMPFLSVRNLIEFVAAVPLVWASWHQLKAKSFSGRFLVPAVLVGIAIGIRYQVLFFGAGWGLALLLQKEWKGAAAFGVVSLATFALTQFGDLIWWDYPMTELMAYIDYNIINATSYFDQPWYTYLLTLAGILIPPISLFLLFGFFKEYRRHLILFLPAFLFLVFHSYFPNKQERFIIPAIPYIVILGTVGFSRFKETSIFWSRRPRLWKGFVYWAITLNTLGTVLLTFTYSKKSRVEAMTYLSKQDDLVNFTVETAKEDFILPPIFYADKWMNHDYVTTSYPAEEYITGRIHRFESVAERPNYVLFYGEENLEERVEKFGTVVGDITYRTTILPGNFDLLLHWLNHRNKVEKVTIYHIEGYHDLSAN